MSFPLSCFSFHSGFDIGTGIQLLVRGKDNLGAEMDSMEFECEGGITI